MPDLFLDSINFQKEDLFSSVLFDDILIDREDLLRDINCGVFWSTGILIPVIGRHGYSGMGEFYSDTHGHTGMGWF